jgi:hypothetical protein
MASPDNPNIVQDKPVKDPDQLKLNLRKKTAQTTGRTKKPKSRDDIGSIAPSTKDLISTISKNSKNTKPRSEIDARDLYMKLEE